MSTIRLEKYGPIISDKEVGDEIAAIISADLAKDQSIVIDLAGIKSMATFCAKQIFGTLYVELGAEGFFDRVRIMNASQEMQHLIRLGIQKALETQG